MNLSDYATLYVQHRDGSPGYLDQLYSAISAIERFTGRPLQLDDLTEQLINDYLWRYRDTLAPVTRRNRRNMIVRLWRHAAHDSLLKTRPRPPVRDAMAHVRQVQTILRSQPGRAAPAAGADVITLASAASPSAASAPRQPVTSRGACSPQDTQRVATPCLAGYQRRE